MSSVPAIQSGITGIQSGLRRLNKDAADIASAHTLRTSDGLTASLVDMTAAKQQVQASAKVISTRNTMIGSLLDMTV